MLHEIERRTVSTFALATRRSKNHSAIDFIHLARSHSYQLYLYILQNTFIPRGTSMEQMQLKCVCGQRVREANNHCLPTAPTVNKPCLLFHSAGSQGDLFMAGLRGFFWSVRKYG
jgi:hypothetical protein